MISSVLAIVLVASCAYAQLNSSVVCIAGQCLQGFTNTTIGTTLSSPGVASSVLLLPGQYSSSTNPALLHQLLTGSSTTVSPSPGFNGSSVSSPFNVALQPGLAVYPQSLYSGSAQFIALPTTPVSNTSTPLAASAISLSTDVWIAVNSGNNRLILWDSVPDVAQLPGTPSLSLTDIQSNACSPQCAGAGVCSSSGQCVCPAGFTGASCETCAPGFFGPSCQACPAGCTTCDDGATGSGRCLSTTVTNPPSSCNCLNGECGTNGQCTCNSGWTTADNGTACAKCAQGFFLDGNGDCSVCQLGCGQCADGSGICVSCKTGFTQDANDRTKCDAVQSVTSTGTVCPDGSFSSGTACTPCSPSCKTCSGPTSNDCILCGDGQFTLGANCVPTDGNGVCQGSNLVANNNKHVCDSCPAKCTSCQIPNFTVASTIDQLQCTGCLPGSVLSQGKCVASCPSGTFLSPQDNLTCTACSSSCGTCAGAADFCLTCASNQLASNGKCVSTCPTATFSSANSCLSCHSDCATCSGSSFNQCSSCPADRPVLTNGRCLPTCSKAQFFDRTTGSCQSCDSSCSSCSASGPSSCLACASSTSVLRGGSCAPANCNGTSGVIPGLGVCLSELVAVPQASGTSSPIPLPSITGINTPAPVTRSSGRPLAWWEILLMALGCAFIFVFILMLWRRRMRRRRAKATAAFAAAKNLNGPSSWGRRLLALFGRTPAQRAQREELKLAKLRHTETERHAREMDKLSALPSYYRRVPAPRYDEEDEGPDENATRRMSALSAGSVYSQVTGAPRRAPDVRQPVRGPEPMASRFSWTTSGSSAASSKRAPTEAQRYANAHRQGKPESPEGARGAYWMEPARTGGSSGSEGSRNPFRR
ncbi:hypothetical protein FA95DRAFT_514665 [Auriscalpium vulgare]|uniref:Uncharacterized protein n=1 Tax=Auriscalpium vulgare TaxID=40419 RepID=A0ACB8RFH4_9AGAM|nr:hypothetical protein FA95DRAFT_514665 [Auriscalpium vulgare]